MDMNQIVIRRPRIEDLDEIHALFETVLRDTYKMNGISDVDLPEELQEKKRRLREDFETNGLDRFFLFAQYHGEIIASAEYGLSSELVNKHTNNEFQGIYEIGTFFIHPKFQRQGISSLLLYHLFSDLHRKGNEEICLDSGYQTAQKIWCKKFGEPQHILKDFWGEGLHHMIWRVRLKNEIAFLKLKITE